MKTCQILLLFPATLIVIWLLQAAARKWQHDRTHPPRLGSPGWEWPGVDPLVASWAHNRLHSPLYRLPSEIFHMIVLCLYEEDFAAFLSFRLVSSPVYHHITGHLSEKVGRDMLGRNIIELKVNESTNRRFDRSARRLYESHLCKERFCARCLGAIHSRAVYKVGGESLEYSMQRHCRVDAGDLVLRCAGCECMHPWSSFSFSQQYAPPPSGRLCIGREGRDGGFRLCAHRRVRWEEIEEGLRIWSGMGMGKSSGEMPGDGNIMAIRCCRGECGRGCGFSEALGSVELGCYAKPSTREFVLRLEWTVHELLDCGADGRLEASGFRSMFREHRRLMPWLRVLPKRGSPDPEMACFFPEGSPCGCIRYVDGVGYEALEREWRHKWLRGNDPPCDSRQHRTRVAKALDVCVSVCRGKFSPDNNRGSGQDNRTAEQEGDMRRQSRKRCVVTTYSREFVFPQLGASRRLFNPFHEWQHLLRQRSGVIARNMDPGSWPACEDPTCAHYLGLALCPAWRHDVRWGLGGAASKDMIKLAPGDPEVSIAAIQRRLARLQGTVDQLDGYTQLKSQLDSLEITVAQIRRRLLPDHM